MGRNEAGRKSAAGIPDLEVNPRLEMEINKYGTKPNLDNIKNHESTWSFEQANVVLIQKVDLKNEVAENEEANRGAPQQDDVEVNVEMM